MNKYYNCEFKLTSARLHRSTDEDEHCIQTLNDLKIMIILIELSGQGHSSSCFLSLLIFNILMVKLA